MPTLDRQNLRWQPPTTNVDGTPIDYPLDYELGSKLTTDAGEPQARFVVVGTLQGDGTYEAPLAQMGWAVGQHELYLRAINHNDLNAVSAWNDPILLSVSASVPNPPTWVGV